MVNHLEEARKIIQNNIYMTIATSDKKGNPWISPVAFSYDSDHNLYWASEKTSKHSKLIKKNNKVAVVIFDSSAPEGQGNGVYLIGNATEVKEKELEHAIKVLYSRKKKDSEYSKFNNIKDFSGKSPWRMYKIVPRSFWILKDNVKVKGYPVDRKIDVKVRDYPVRRRTEIKLN